MKRVVVIVCTTAALGGIESHRSQELANQTKFAWARRNFTLSQEQAGGLAVLRWNRIGSGSPACFPTASPRDLCSRVWIYIF